ncbi:hypothetical protein AYO21_03246 [Fonsecaea monophora]|uniref:Transcription factor domain-containing protein n=1 Tax=Fonsecaea monophora TaxID=254056 RepID=A0A177FG24_9EURO|nr:hypothetical protein AYO21_03246 [Fonsecaea monophora]OAG42661.1 hypothetical protein AYO21_03246 [Fonsecaea monophora]
MEPLVSRLARERDRKGTQVDVLANATDQTQSNDMTFMGNYTALDPTSYLGREHEFNPTFDLDAQLGLTDGNAYVNALNFDLGFEFANMNGFSANTHHQQYDSTQFQPQTLPEQEIATGIAASGILDSHQPIPQLQQYPQQLINDTGDVCAPTTMALEEHCKTLSPLLSQLFNNEMFTQNTACISSILAQKVEFMSFSDLTKCVDSTDAEKLLSTISSEPHVHEVLDISVKWWIAWRDQAVAMQEFSPFRKDDQQQTQAQGSSTSGSWLSGMQTGANASPFSHIWPGSTTTSHTMTRSDEPLSFRDFVLTKLSRTHDLVSLATGLLCIALSLYQLRPGVDDQKLNISTSPSELADRITLVVDTVVLSPTAQQKHKHDPGILLLLMIRAKMYAESNQLRKSWLSTRRALEIAQEIGFAEPKIPADAGQFAPKMCGQQLTQLFNRQRFIGSIMELDRLMSMTLGFPHAEDVKFTDRLAMAVLKGQTSSRDGASVSVEIKMRAFRRVVSIAAGRVNDRNATSDPDPVKLQTTMEIQATLDEIAAAMPPDWWDVESHLGVSDSFRAHENLLAQMWFWQVQAFLHLPFMLKVDPNIVAQNQHPGDHITPDPYAVNKHLCMQGCRSMLRIFNLLRSDPSLAVYICSCEDFQGLFSACILMVGLLMRLSYCSESRSQPGSVGMGNISDDLALIEEIKEVFRYRATQQGGSISGQGLKVLRELGSFLYEDAETLQGADVKHRTVVLPYFGAIHLELRPPRLLRRKCTGMANMSHPCRVPELHAEPPQMESQSSSEPVSDEGFGPTYPDPFDSTAYLPNSAWDVPGSADADDATFQFSVEPGASLDWDRFLFGSELAQSWSAEVPE